MDPFTITYLIKLDNVDKVLGKHMPQSSGTQTTGFVYRDAFHVLTYSQLPSVGINCQLFCIVHMKYKSLPRQKSDSETKIGMQILLMGKQQIWDNNCNEDLKCLQCLLYTVDSLIEKQQHTRMSGFQNKKAKWPVHMKRFSNSLTISKMQIKIMEYYFTPGFFSFGTTDILNLIIPCGGLSCALWDVSSVPVSVHCQQLLLPSPVVTIKMSLSTVKCALESRITPIGSHCFIPIGLAKIKRGITPVPGRNGGKMVH